PDPWRPTRRAGPRCGLSGVDHRVLGCARNHRWSVDLAARRRDELRQGATRAGRVRLARVPVGAGARRERAQHGAGGWPMIPGDQLVEPALTAPPADETIVIVTDNAEASLRWAGNSMTTNGSARARGATILAIRRTPDGAHCGVVSAAIVDADDIGG